MPDQYLRICDNCFDFDREKNQCLVRFTILKDKTRIPMKITPLQRGCDVFMYGTKTKKE